MTKLQQITPYICPIDSLIDFIEDWEEAHLLSSGQRYYCEDVDCFSHYQKLKDILEIRSSIHKIFIFQVYDNIGIITDGQLRQATIVPNLCKLKVGDVIVLLDDAGEGIDCVYRIDELDEVSETELGLILTLTNIFESK